MKTIPLYILFLGISLTCYAQEKVSSRKFSSIALVNHIEFVDNGFNQPRFSCAFLLDYRNSIYAITAKHILPVIKPDMKTLFFDNIIRNWFMYPLDKKEQVVSTGKLLNANSNELLADKKNYVNDWLVFSVPENLSAVTALVPRLTPLTEGEKLYVIGWTRKMEEGAQRVYEFTFYKKTENRLLLKELVAPETFGGLSGAPVVDENGALVGIVSNSTADPVTGKTYFSPCVLDGLLLFIDKFRSE